LARCFSEQKIAPQTDYITTRLYRAPEIFLGHGLFQNAIDLWGSGCIICELLLRQNLFSGNDGFEMLTQMISFLGMPDPQFLADCRKEKYIEFISKIPKNEDPRLRSMIRNKDIYDLVSKLLVFEPEKRISSMEALHHPFFLSNDKEVIIETSSNIEIFATMNAFELSFDTRALNIDDYRRYVLREISSYHQNKEELYTNDEGNFTTNRIEDEKISKCLIL
jgi:serine/threonine protein kinase